MTQSAEHEDVALREVYAAEFRNHAIMLIWLGYRRLNAPSLAKVEEDEITQALAQEMEQVCEDSASPEWVEQCEVHEQTRQNVEGKSGKGRPVMDVEIRRHRRGSRFRLGFEAKRLGRGLTIGGYLGEEGLAAFVTGYYPMTHDEAGMLGYVQEETCADWSDKLRGELSRNSNKHRLAADGQLQPFGIDPTTPAFLSGHLSNEGDRLVVVHILLSFTR